MTPSFGLRCFRFWNFTFLFRIIGGCCLFSLLFIGLARADTAMVGVKKMIQQYALTSANDFPQRDPQDWRLLGSNDGGKTWVTLDARHGEIFTARQQRKLYKINNQTAFATYRLQIDRVRNPATADSVQLAEIELMGRTENDLTPTPVFSDIVSAQGDNPPAEVVGNLFDGRVETKWLDWPTDQSTYSSWVQWQYVAPTECLVTNVNQLQSLRQHAANAYPVQITAVVVGRVERNQLCIVDATGGIALDGLAGLNKLQPGQTVTITGTSAWTGQQVSLWNGDVRPLAPAAATESELIFPGELLPAGEDFKWATVEGQIQYPRFAGHGFTFNLQDNGLNLRVHLPSLPNPDSLPPAGSRISLSGICVGAFNEQGQWLAADFWVADLRTLTVVNSQANDPVSSIAPASTKSIASSPKLITHIGEIRRLTQEQIRNHPPVKIRGVITGLLGGFIQDESGGIEFDLPSSERRNLTRLGEYVEVDGSTELSGLGTPLIAANRVIVLGRGQLPPPQKLPLSQATIGRIDGQWTEVEGVVHATDGAHLLIIFSGGELMATLARAAAGEVNNLVDAEVRVQGVGVAAMDDEGRIQGINLLVPSTDQIEVLDPPSDPARLPVRPISSLLGLSEPRELFHRVKVEGVLTLQENQRIFLQDDSGSMMVIPKEAVALNARFGRSRWLYWQIPQAGEAADIAAFKPGDRVQVVGFPEMNRYSRVLTEATLTRLGSVETVNPVEITTAGITEGGLDSTLVTLEGILRGQNTIGSITLLALEWQDRTIQISVPGAENDLRKIALGSRLRVTGVCQLDPAPYAELGLGVEGVHIQARSSADIRVLAQPSWWTIQHTLTLMGAMAVLILAALIWIKELRRQVGEQTTQLSAEIQLREQTERRHALEQERSRIAQDLHDDLGTNLTQIVFLSERVEAARHDGHETTPWFKLIPATAQRTIQSLDEIVWAINPQHDSLESLANYLSQFAQEYLTLARMRCVLDVPTVLPSVPLSAEIRHNLLLAAREALQNAVTHAAATEVRLTLKLDPHELSIAITDNGRGFDPDSVPVEGNGLKNMRRRMQKIGGRWEINSRTGQGTTVTLILHSRVIGENQVSR